ncbi:Hypothetical predicted protein [Olea europaea subsp. europaea]|uniref:Uncharacterized protein n=1 Tax=Olea europaea subsp. europaea TaxID=158383 RepID=A0A8S0VDZ9_OLEEU|nr:Hypothetical predicted protein [Olea europaea subsp. europaea]
MMNCTSIFLKKIWLSEACLLIYNLVNNLWSLIIIYTFSFTMFALAIFLIHIQMPLKRKLKHVLTIRSAASPNSGNGSPSSRGQGEHSNQLHIFVSTPSTTQSDEFGRCIVRI